MRRYVLASRHAAPLMAAARSGLIATTTCWDRNRFPRDNPQEDRANASMTRLAFAIAALAADANVLTRSGRPLRVAHLPREYGFTDVDGRQPEAFELET